MRALVVFESLYGNTAAVGEVVARSLRSRGYDVAVGSVSNVSAAETGAVDLLVVGGPTHAHGMSRASTRKAGATDKKNTYADPTAEPGLREWLDALPSGSGRGAAAFDTRFDKPILLTGSAAKGIARRLEHAEYRVIVQPESFFVTTENQLKDGEIERATAWAKVLTEHAREAAA